MRQKARLKVAVFVIGVSLTGCLSNPALEQTDTVTKTESTASESTQSISKETLQNLVYSSEWTKSGEAPLINGQFQEEIVPGSASKLNVSLTEYITRGQLGDHQDAAAVILTTDPGGSGTFYDLAVVANDTGKVKSIAVIFLGDRVKINSISLNNGVIKVDMLIHGPEDAMCCPSQRVIQIYELSGDAIELTSSELITAETK